MNRIFAGLIGGLTAAVSPIAGAAQIVAPAPPPMVIPCEGPDMPAACPRPDGPPRSIDAARDELAAQQAAMLRQQQALAEQRRDLAGGLRRAQQPPRPAAASLNPFLAPPDPRQDAQIIRGILSGDGP